MNKLAQMTKQEILDIETPTAEEWITQQLITGLNKTQLINAERSVMQMYQKAYKTAARELPFSVIVNALITATNIATNGTKPMENTVENKGQ